MIKMRREDDVNGVKRPVQERGKRNEKYAVPD